MRSWDAPLARLEHLLGSVDRDQPDPAHVERFDWYGATCPCGKVPGECGEHPRARPSQHPPSGAWRTWLAMT